MKDGISKESVSKFFDKIQEDVFKGLDEGRISIPSTEKRVFFEHLAKRDGEKIYRHAKEMSKKIQNGEVEYDEAD